MTQNRTLRVKMLGEFSMTWDGKEICGSSKSVDSQFIRLLQLLIYNRKNGLERTRLQSLIFDDSSAEDVHHTLRTVIYNARKKLKNTGLPDVQYIEFRDGRYFWTDEIPVEIDAEMFETLCAEIEAEQDDEARLKKSVEAISVYKGNFLPNQMRLSWVVAEDSKYKELFSRCVEVAADLLRKKRDYNGLEKLGRKASVVCPLSEWEYLILEAYIFTGRIGKAQELHEKTLDYYRKRLGVVSIPEYTQRVEQFMEIADIPSTDIEGIAAELREKSDPECNGLYCSYPVLYGIYHMLEQSEEIFCTTPYLMLCSVALNSPDKHTDNGRLEEYTEQVRSAICISANKDNVICRFSKSQFLIMVLNGSYDACRELESRINKNFRKNENGNVSLSFSTLPLRRDV